MINNQSPNEDFTINSNLHHAGIMAHLVESEERVIIVPENAPVRNAKVTLEGSEWCVAGFKFSTYDIEKIKSVNDRIRVYVNADTGGRDELSDSLESLMSSLGVDSSQAENIRKVWGV